jgi:hypothetical protein
VDCARRAAAYVVKWAAAERLNAAITTRQAQLDMNDLALLPGPIQTVMTNLHTARINQTDFPAADLQTYMNWGAARQAELAALQSLTRLEKYKTEYRSYSYQGTYLSFDNQANYDADVPARFRASRDDRGPSASTASSGRSAMPCWPTATPTRRASTSSTRALTADEARTSGARSGPAANSRRSCRRDSKAPRGSASTPSSSCAPTPDPTLVSQLRPEHPELLLERALHPEQHMLSDGVERAEKHSALANSLSDVP